MNYEKLLKLVNEEINNNNYQKAKHLLIEAIKINNNSFELVYNLGLVNNKKMRVTKNSNFDDFEHELYDLSEDPHEINNIGYKKNSNKKILKRYFNNLNELENLL